jgi:hypothetical protein
VCLDAEENILDYLNDVEKKGNLFKEEVYQIADKNYLFTFSEYFNNVNKLRFIRD